LPSSSAYNWSTSWAGGAAGITSEDTLPFRLATALSGDLRRGRRTRPEPCPCWLLRFLDDAAAGL
jgi:hypothetical protein